ncbi:MAG: ABC transporter permease subunit [Actinophytocola sp.]|uniref:ABC transporter permease n=1 Tax=Actinophytocola sp. TaxID=1872138 RepID=UPI0013273921|nr:ABC transporter permease [Actinophytocola sp.]MPZ82983.1 ABC transporter permease subunit [Actinophytocola sp.]
MTATYEPTRTERLVRERRRARRPGRTRVRWVVRVVSVVAFLGTWEIVANRVSPLFLPAPTAILEGMVDGVRTGELTRAAGVSLETFAVGFLISAAIGVPVGLAMGRSRVVEHTLDSFVYALYVVPTMAFVPLLVLWFGIGTVSKLIIVVSVAVFPIIINTYVGAKNVGPSMVDIGRSMSAGRWKNFSSIVVPASLPFILAGLRLAIGRALSGVVVGELFTAISGLGGLLMTYSNLLRTQLAFGPVVVLMVLGIGFTALLRFVESRVVAWKETERHSDEP